MNLLHIYSSIPQHPSISGQMSDRIVDALRLVMPDLKVVRRNLEADPLPDHNKSPTGAAASVAARREQELGANVLAEFLKADVVVIGASMGNFAIAKQLKAWIDRVLVAGETFRFTQDGVQGLAAGKKVIIASSRPAALDAAETSIDFQEVFLRSELGFIGIENVEIVRAATPEPKAARKHTLRFAPTFTRRMEPTLAT